jgi:hypothetical protein
MAITTRALQSDTKGFMVNAHSADASATEELVAAPGSGVALRLTQAIFTCVAAITLTLGEGETGGNVTNRIFGPMNFAATSGSPVVFRPNTPVRLTSNTSLTIEAGGAGAVHVYVEGFTEDG